MRLIPIQKAFDVSSRNSAYIFSCPHRNFPIIISYQSLNLLAEINNIDTALSLLEVNKPEFFDAFELGVSYDCAIGQLLRRGYRVSEVSRLTDIQPLEITMYYSGIVSPDEITMKIILEYTGNSDIAIDNLNYVYGEVVRTF